MDDKTRLELDLEQLERYKTPPGIKALIVILIIIILFLGFHSLTLKRLVQEKDARIVVIKKEFYEERKKLYEKVRGLEEKPSEQPLKNTR